MNVGQVLKRYGLRATELARMVGVSDAAISAIIHGKDRLSTQLEDRIRQALGELVKQRQLRTTETYLKAKADDLVIPDEGIMREAVTPTFPLLGDHEEFVTIEELAKRG